jgi:hypothetical protein
MKFSGNYRGATKVTALSGPVSALVTQLHTELQSLVTRNQELRRRIRSIHRVLSGLQEMGTTPAFDDFVAIPLPSHPDRTIASRSRRHRASGSRGISNHVSVNLQRACRIALMEAATAASLEEIYERIVRRGSHSFVNIERASPVLLRVLRVMAQDGEVRRLQSGPCWYWDRMALVKEI